MLDFSQFIDQTAFDLPIVQKSPSPTPKKKSTSIVSTPVKKVKESKFPPQENLVEWWQKEKENVLESKYSCVQHKPRKIKKIKEDSEYQLIALPAIQTLMLDFFTLKAQGKKLWNNLPDGGIFPLRFAISATFNLWFAFDGTPDSIIPGHHSMLKKASSKTAGQVFFDDSKLLCGISNESGNYRPAFISLAWFFAIVYAMDSLSQLKEPFFLLWASSSGSTYKRYSLTHDEISKLVVSLFSTSLLEELRQANQGFSLESLKSSPVKSMHTTLTKVPFKAISNTPRKKTLILPYEKAISERFDDLPSLIALSTLTGKAKQVTVTTSETDLTTSAEQTTILGMEH